MGDSRRYVFLVLMCLITPLFQSALADRPNQESPHLTIFQDDGLVFNETLYLNGSSTVPLTNFEWLLVDISDELKIQLDSGKLTFVHAIGDAEWDWNLVLNVSSYNCTCELIVFDTYSNTLPLTSKIIYIGSQNHHPVLLPFISPYQRSHPIHLLTDTDMEIVVPVVTPIGSGSEFIVKLGICSAPNGFCLNEMIDYFDFNFTSELQELKLIFDPENINLNDGYWLFNITVVDALLHTSNTEHFMVLFDQNMPATTLTCDVEETSLSIDDEDVQSKIRVEEYSLISFSASVDDGYSGGDNIFTWTFILPDGSRRALLEHEQVTDTLISLRPDLPGTWVVELLVRDTAGWLNHSSIEFEVQNLAPMIQIELDSFVVTEGSTVTITDGETWELNSSKSSDTINDDDTLFYTWYVNGDAFVSGKTTLQSSDFSESGLYDVRLLVEDNDGATSEVSFKVHISEVSESDTFNAKTMFFSVSILVLIVLVIGFLISSSRRYSNQTTVPKWIVKDTSEQFNDHDESNL